MNKFELYERLWREINSENSYLPEIIYTESDYKKYKEIFSKNFLDTNKQFCQLLKVN